MNFFDKESQSKKTKKYFLGGRGWGLGVGIEVGGGGWEWG